MKKYLRYILVQVIIFIPWVLHAQVTRFPLENGGFEQWEIPAGLDSTMMEPVDWSSLKTSDNTSLSSVAPVVWAKSTDAHSGNYSVKLFNVEIFNTIATGTLTNGRVHADMDPQKGYIYTDTTDARWNSRIDSRPDSLTGWFKCDPASGDSGVIEVDLHVGFFKQPPSSADSANMIGMAVFYMPSVKVDQWTRFAVPVEYISEGKPAFYLCILNSGSGFTAKNGSAAWIDDLAFVYNNSPAKVQDIKQVKLRVYASFGNIHIRMDHSNITDYHVIVADILGRLVFRNKLSAGDDLMVDPGRTGIYIVRVYHGQENYVKKVLLK